MAVRIVTREWGPSRRWATCNAGDMSEVVPVEVTAVEVQSHGTFRRLGVLVAIVSAVALVGAFIPVSTIGAGVLAALGLAFGVGCLIRDPGFNRAALVGTVLCSAALSAAVIMTLVYA